MSRRQRDHEQEQRQEAARREVAELIHGLERHASEAVDLSGQIQAGQQGDTFSAYRSFRRKYSDFRALVSLIEGRMTGLDGAKADALREEFGRLDAVMLTVLVRTMAGFFRIMVDDRELPLGCHELFEAELELVHGLEPRVTDAAAADARNADLPGLLDQAKVDLQTLIDRAPALPDFGQTQRRRRPAFRSGYRPA